MWLVDTIIYTCCHSRLTNTVLLMGDVSLCPSCSSSLLLKHILMEWVVSTLYCSVDTYERIFNEVRPDLVLKFESKINS